MHKDIKHISFDVWNTLISPNLQYSQYRNASIAQHFNINLDSAKTAYTNTKRSLDSIAEVTGKSFSTETCWMILANNLKKDSSGIDTLIQKCNSLFERFKPHLDRELVDELYNLEIQGFDLSIKSNTNFISGSVLNKVLFNSLQCFDFKHYSDEYRLAKPSYTFFLKTSTITGLDAKQILHIGDNLICDGKCTELEWQFEHVKNPQDLFQKLKNKEIV